MGSEMCIRDSINSNTISITLEGIEETSTEKMTTKHSEYFFFISAARKRQQTLKWLLDFDWLLKLFDSLLVYFGGLKYILARKMRHNARQSDNNN